MQSQLNGNYISSDMCDSDIFQFSDFLARGRRGGGGGEKLTMGLSLSHGKCDYLVNLIASLVPQGIEKLGQGSPWTHVRQPMVELQKVYCRGCYKCMIL